MPELRVTVVSIPVSDQERARSFYRDVLGVEEVANVPYRDDLRWVQVRPPGSTTSFTLVTWFPSMPAGSLQGIVVETPDVQAAYLELLRNGVHFTHEPRDEPWGTYTTFSDPDGNSFVLAQASSAG